MNRIRAALAIVAVSSLLAAACGPTVQHPPTTNAGSGLAAPGGGATVAPGTTTGSGGKTGGGTTGGGTTGGSTGGGFGTTGGSGPTGGESLPTGTGGGKHIAVPPSLPGVTDSTIYLGSYYNKNAGAGNAAIGAGGLNESDARKPQQVMINWVNTHGGVAGRKLSAIYYGFDGSGTGPPIDQQEQSACNKWTQDNKVFAILAGGSAVVDECSKKEGAVEFGQYGTPTTYRAYPHRIDVDTINQVRSAKITINGLSSLRYFNSGAKIGVITWDQSDFKEAINDGLLPALKSHGLSLATDPYYIAVAQSLQDFGASSAAINSAVLKFSGLGIDHVMIFDGPAGTFKGGTLTIEWMKRSESQQYYPRYGFNDSNLPIELQGLGLMSNRQAQGSDYVNSTDLGPNYETGYHANPNGQTCRKIMQANGVDMSNADNEANALVACEDMWFLQGVGEELTTLHLDLTADDFISAVEHLGYSYLSPLSYANFFSPQQHDGGAGVRYARFDSSSNTYKWVGGVYKVG